MTIRTIQSRAATHLGLTSEPVPDSRPDKARLRRVQRAVSFITVFVVVFAAMNRVWWVVVIMVVVGGALLAAYSFAS